MIRSLAIHHKEFLLNTFRLASLLLFSSSAHPQATITQYRRTTFSGTYSSISGSFGPSGDDNALNVSLPFVFPYDGHDYDRARICTNGWVELGSATRPLSSSSSAYNSSLFTSDQPNKTLAPWWDDLATASGSIQYALLGSSPHRAFAVEWNNVLSYFT